MPVEPKYDVLIVGLGPVGATLGNLLGKFGVSTLILEKEAHAYHLPRAVQFDDEVMRVFQSIGLANPIEKITRINPGMQFVDKDNNLLLDWPRPPGVSKLGWKSSYRFHQPDLECILRNGLDRFDYVHTKSRHEVFDIEERDLGLIARHRNRDTGEEFQETTRFVVGCDGARSFVRQTMATEMEDFGFEEKWLVVDLVLKRELPHLGDHTVQYCNPDRPSTYVRGPGSRRRWEITVHPDEDPDEIVRDDRVWELLRRWLEPTDAKLVRRAVYQFQSCIAKSWRRGRILIAGDAAHLMPPFMGQGMCTGIRDVANLAWKLAHCVESERKGGSSFEILDSYGVERRPHVREYIDTAVKLGGLINASGSLEDLNAAFRQPDGSVRMKMIEPRLGDSDVLLESPRSGKISSQPLLRNGKRLDDCVECGDWILFRKTEAEDQIGARLSKYVNLKVMDSGSEPEVKSLLDDMDVSAVLVRPDRYIFGTAKREEDLSLLMESARCFLRGQDYEK